jgi:putative ABC transport system permease protein
MLLEIAWRNVLRNKKRSFIIIAAIACGLWASLVSSGVSFGFSYATIRSSLETRLSHIQIHAPGFMQSRSLRDTIAGGTSLLGVIRRIPSVRAVSGRLLVDGMASTAETALGVRVNGVDGGEERTTTTIAERLVAGSYDLGQRRNVVVIGEELAGKLGARPGSKVILTMQDIHGDIIGGSFRIAGIFRTDSTPFDVSTVFVDRRELAGLLGMGNVIHEIAVLVDDVQHVDSSAARIRAILPALRTETWMELAPELRYINQYTEVYLDIFLYVIVLALLFGIMNTMLMSVLERTREFGVLTAVGMRGRRVFVMIMLESLVLSLVGGIAGILTGWATVAQLERTGINLAAFGEGLRQYGYAEMAYPVLPASMYEQVIVSIVIAAVLGAVYPALRAIRLEPARAIRTY